MMMMIIRVFDFNEFRFEQFRTAQATTARSTLIQGRSQWRSQWGTQKEMTMEILHVDGDDDDDDKERKEAPLQCLLDSRRVQEFP